MWHSWGGWPLVCVVVNMQTLIISSPIENNNNILYPEKILTRSIPDVLLRESVYERLIVWDGWRSYTLQAEL
ncbi:MAG: hypothetical protein II954_07960 [Synergistaceae bacterium]|nr:hypothetical protein [Synergistaceae bacterium]